MIKDLNDYELIEIGLSSMCNLNCPLCTRNKTEFKNQQQYQTKYKKNQYLPLDNLIKFIEMVNPKTIKLIGAVGEPTLYPQFLDLIEFLSFKGISIWLSTNGSTHDHKFWRRFGMIVPDGSIINFDIDHTDDIKQKFYRRGSDLGKILENSRAFVEANSRKTITTRIQRIDFIWNKDNLNDMEYKIKNYDNWKHFDNVYTIPCYDFNPEEFNETTNELNKWVGPNNFLYKSVNSLTSKRLDIIPIEDIDCESVREKSIYLNYVGEVIPCCYINDEVLKNQLNYPNIYQLFDAELNVVPYQLEKITNFLNDVQQQKCVFSDTCKFFCNKKSKQIYKNFNLDP